MAQRREESSSLGWIVGIKKGEEIVCSGKEECSGKMSHSFQLAEVQSKSLG